MGSPTAQGNVWANVQKRVVGVVSSFSAV